MAFLARKFLPTLVASAGGAALQHYMGTKEDPGDYEPPRQPQQSDPQPVHTPQQPINANQGLAKDVYQQEQYATNTSDTQFMGYPMWRSGVATSEYIPPEVLEPIVARESAPTNPNAATNRLSDAGVMAALGMGMSYGPLPFKALGYGLQLAGGTLMGSEAVAQYQASQTPKIPDPDLTDDQAQIEADYKALPQQYAKAGFGGQSKVVSILEPTRKNADVSKRIKKRLLRDEEPSFSKSHPSSSSSSSSPITPDLTDE